MVGHPVRLIGHFNEGQQDVEPVGHQEDQRFILRLARSRNAIKGGYELETMLALELEDAIPNIPFHFYHAVQCNS